MARPQLLAECRPYVIEARKALAKFQLFAGFRNRVDRDDDGVELIGLRNTVPIDVTLNPSVTGRWSLHLAWTLRRVPRDEPIVWQSSFGLDVRGLPFGDTDRAVSFVRYDVDNSRRGHTLAPLGPHLNVLQPPPMVDAIHFPTLSTSDGGWAVRDVLDFLLSSALAEELRGSIGPR